MIDPVLTWILRFIDCSSKQLVRNYLVYSTCGSVEALKTNELDKKLLNNNVQSNSAHLVSQNTRRTFSKRDHFIIFQDA